MNVYKIEGNENGYVVYDKEGNSLFGFAASYLVSVWLEDESKWNHSTKKNNFGQDIDVFTVKEQG